MLEAFVTGLVLYVILGTFIAALLHSNTAKGISLGSWLYVIRAWPALFYLYERREP